MYAQYKQRGDLTEEIERLKIEIIDISATEYVNMMNPLKKPVVAISERVMLQMESKPFMQVYAPTGV